MVQGKLVLPFQTFASTLTDLTLGARQIPLAHLLAVRRQQGATPSTRLSSGQDAGGETLTSLSQPRKPRSSPRVSNSSACSPRSKSYGRWAMVRGQARPTTRVGSIRPLVGILLAFVSTPC
jgi:hypothetical protein